MVKASPGKQDNAARLRALVESTCPCIWIVTDEEDYAIRLAQVAAIDTGRPLRIWSVVRGLADGLVEGSRAEAGTENPAAALFHLGVAVDSGITAMLDLTPHLGDERTLRALRDLIHRIDLGGRDAGKLVLIDHSDALPAVIRARAARLEIALPDEKEIEEIIWSTLRRVHRQRSIELGVTRSQLGTIVRNLRGLTRSQVERVVVEAVWDDQKLLPDDLEGMLARKRELIRADGLLEFVQSPASMDEVGGLNTLKRWLERRRNALSDDAVAFGLDAPRGVLMLGVQGAGKSLCAKAIATAWQRPLMRLDPSVLFDRFIGESEKRLRQALEQAELMAPVILWIDEIEKGFASAASHSVDGGLSQRMFGTLLTWMQEHRAPVFVAATANNIEALPPELLRKGRFDEIFFVDLPDLDARRKIFEVHLKRRNQDPRKFELDQLASASDGCSGAEIEQAVIAGLHEAFASKKPLATEHILAALRASPPLSVTMAERIAALRQWAAGRCVPAN
jgi:MoxR-like ATPase